ncbi:hypothetical protein MAPG_03037 [Magnaporthiopsis poae ATCC 64411]|uniref:Uncharacterized protein n=1 Tax=Magnaporthiopsis poae (strain ATCC 64411 / 73-15) TaxID=644358 RepID=A0A0C4DSZ0_MAGP6|nr:hypothetical protein MAPG_03037 [Magnaporthiopsis poae ATCC 64411]
MMRGPSTTPAENLLQATAPGAILDAEQPSPTLVAVDAPRFRERTRNITHRNGEGGQQRRERRVGDVDATRTDINEATEQAPTHAMPSSSLKPSGWASLGRKSDNPLGSVAAGLFMLRASFRTRITSTHIETHRDSQSQPDLHKSAVAADVVRPAKELTPSWLRRNFACLRQ